MKLKGKSYSITDLLNSLTKNSNIKREEIKKVVRNLGYYDFMLLVEAIQSVLKNCNKK